MKIHVTIDRLILEGLTVPHGERQALQEAVAAELGRLLGEQGLAAGGLARGAVPLGFNHRQVLLVRRRLLLKRASHLSRQQILAISNWGPWQPTPGLGQLSCRVDSL
jgi:hypothetical protein